MQDRSLFAPFPVCALMGLIAAALSPGQCEAATATTPNFVIHAPQQRMADEVARAAEHYRRELAIEWVGRPLPKWSARCPVNCRVGDHLGAGGDTTFSFDGGEVFGWRMNVQGSMQRILDSVLPHEISHTIFACHFRRPLPRWADEGAATLVEHAAERRRQSQILARVIRTSRRIPLSQLLTMTEYPTNHEDVLTLYAEGYSLADLLVQEKGKRTYLRFLEDGHRRGWSRALATHYDYRSIPDLETRWRNWVIAGSPAIETPAADGQILAGGDSIDRDSFTREGYQRLLAGRVRGQSPDTSRSEPATPTSQAPTSRPPTSKPATLPAATLASAGLSLGEPEPIRLADAGPIGRAALAPQSPAPRPLRNVGDPRPRQPRDKMVAPVYRTRD